nr:hypothetical protein CFP56_46901 [Quercus suber]
MKVSELIDPATHKWDQNLLHGLFIPHEAELIASIPLCLNKVEDVVGLSIPPKVRNFLWRACQNAFPVKYNLRWRHILTEDTCELSSQALATFHDSVSSASKQIQRSSPAQIRWFPPLVGWVKVNFDGALFKDIRNAGIGVIVRDSNGQAIASLSEQPSLPFSPEIAEAMATARALSFVQDLGFTSFIWKEIQLT